MPAPNNPGRGNPGQGPGSEQPGQHPLRRFRQFVSWSHSQIYRVSQVAVEALVQKAGNARVSQVATEALVQKKGNARVSQVAVEVLVSTHERALTPTFAGTSSLSAAVSRRASLRVTLAGTSSLSATVSTSSGATVPIAVTLAGTSSLSARVGHPDYLTPLLAGTSSLAASILQTDYLIVEFDGTSQLLLGPPGPEELLVRFDGTSSLSTEFGIEVEFVGSSTFITSLHRGQFVLALNGVGTLTFIWDLGAPGARLSQITNQAAYVGDDPTLILSQVTLEVARKRSGVHVWVKF